MIRYLFTYWYQLHDGRRFRRHHVLECPEPLTFIGGEKSDRLGFEIAAALLRALDAESVTVDGFTLDRDPGTTPFIGTAARTASRLRVTAAPARRADSVGPDA